MTPKAVPTPIDRKTQSSEEVQRQIRRRAYELYEERGRTEGHELDDWLQAEAELIGKSKIVAG